MQTDKPRYQIRIRNNNKIALNTLADENLGFIRSKQSGDEFSK